MNSVSPDQDLTGDDQRMFFLAGLAQKGDAAALQELRGLLDQYPAFCQMAGDLAKHVELSQLKLVAGQNAVLRESLERKLAVLKRELAGEAPLPLERLLVDRVGICWLWANHADLMLVEAPGDDAARLKRLQQRSERANRSFLAAAKQLAVVRKLCRHTERRGKVRPN